MPFTAGDNQNYFEIPLAFPNYLDIVSLIEQPLGTGNEHLARRNRFSGSAEPFRGLHGALDRHHHWSNLTMRKPIKSYGHSYFVVMIDYGQRGLEAVVQPEITRREVIARLKSGEYQNVEFIHHIMDGLMEDVTFELIEAAEAELKDEVRAIRAAKDAA
jgi:hypothetical protein